MSLGLNAISDTVETAIDKIWEDKDAANELEFEREKLKAELVASLDGKKLKAASDIIVAETSGDKFQRRWRPTLMYVIIAIIGNNFLLAPYLDAIFGWSVSLELPEWLWETIKIGMGGYIGGRSLEKISDKGGAKGLYNSIAGR